MPQVKDNFMIQFDYIIFVVYNLFQGRFGKVCFLRYRPYSLGFELFGRYKSISMKPFVGG